MTLFLIFVHLCASVLIAVLWRRGRLHVPAVMLLPVFLLPLWGPVCALAAELHFLGGEKADEEPGTGRFGITDEVYRSIRMADDDVSGIQPIEDVLEWGTPVQRRSLLLSVLHTGADPFVRPLRAAGVNDDTEVVHYAVTALVELRSVFTKRITEMENRLQQHPDDISLLSAAADLDEEYLKSGIPEDAERTERLVHLRTTLEKLLQNTDWQETAANSAGTGRDRWVTSRGQGTAEPIPDRCSLLNRLGKICLQQGDTEAADRIGRRLIEEAPDRETGYMLLLDSKIAGRDGAGIAETIESIRGAGIYLSPGVREKLAFWTA